MSYSLKRIIVVLIVIVLVFGVKLYLNKSATGTAIDEIERKRGPISELLEEREVRDGEVVFYLRQEGDRAPVLSADYVNKSFLGWKWSVGGGHSLPAVSGNETTWSYQYMPASKGGFFNHSPFPLLYGTVDDPAVTSVTIKSMKTGKEIEAEIITTKSKVTLWYAFTQEEEGKAFELTGLNKAGETVGNKRIFDSE